MEFKTLQLIVCNQIIKQIQIVVSIKTKKQQQYVEVYNQNQYLIELIERSTYHRIYDIIHKLQLPLQIKQNLLKTGFIPSNFNLQIYRRCYPY